MRQQRGNRPLEGDHFQYSCSRDLEGPFTAYVWLRKLQKLFNGREVSLATKTRKER